MELIEYMFLFIKCFMEEIEWFLVREYDDVEVRIDFVKTKLLLLTKIA